MVGSVLRATSWYLFALVLAHGSPAQASEASTRILVLLDQGIRALDDEAQSSVFDALDILSVLATPDDRVGLIEIGHPARVMMPPLSVARDAGQARLSRAARTLTEGGGAEHVLPSLEAGLDALGPRSPDTRDVLVVVLTAARFAWTEGDDGPSIQSVVDDARVRSVSINFIVLGDGPDAVRLEGIARQTGGAYRERVSPGRLHRALFDLAAVEERVDVLTPKGGAFLVDDDVSRLAIIMSKSRGQPNELQLADESKLLAGAPGWTDRSDYDLVLVDAPVSGPWRAEQGKLDDLVVAVRGATTILDVGTRPDVPILDTPTRVYGRLVQGGKTLQSYARLKDMKMSFVLGGEETLSMTRSKEGEFEGVWTPARQGVLEGVLEARAPGFRRSRRLRISVDRQCFSSNAQWSSGEVAVEVVRERGCADLAEVVVRGIVVGGTEEAAEWVEFDRGEEDTYSATLQFDHEPERIRIEARALTRQKERVYPLADIELPSDGAPMGLAGFALRIVFANSPLALGLLGFVFRRRMDMLSGGFDV